MSLFIKFIIIWKISFWDKSEQMTVANHRSHIIKLAILFPRKPYKNECLFSLRKLHDLLQTLLCCQQQRLLPEQIRTRISGNAKFRENEYRRPVPMRLINPLTDPLCIICTVCHPDLWCQSRYLYKPVLHASSFLPLQANVCFLPAGSLILLPLRDTFYYRTDSQPQSSPRHGSYLPALSFQG